MAYHPDNGPMDSAAARTAQQITSQAARQASATPDTANALVNAYTDATRADGPSKESVVQQAAQSLLTDIHAARLAFELAELAAIAAAVQARVTWAEIGDVLGMAGPNAHRKYSKLLETKVAVRQPEVTVHLIGGPADGAIREVPSGPDGLPPKRWTLTQTNEASDEGDVEHVYERDGLQDTVWIMRWVESKPVGMSH